MGGLHGGRDDGVDLGGDVLVGELDGVVVALHHCVDCRVHLHYEVDATCKLLIVGIKG